MSDISAVRITCKLASPVMRIISLVSNRSTSLIRSAAKAWRMVLSRWLFSWITWAFDNAAISLRVISLFFDCS
ncbi:MAG: hypothetical protein ACLTZT_19030 [Butyricimonas faecalis]